MKTIEATWENRNLGVETKEFEFEPSDSIATIDLVDKDTFEYGVLKIPSTRPDALIYAKKRNYILIEDIHNLICTINKLEISKQYSGLLHRIRFSEANDNEIYYILQTMKSGTTYTTDRIAIDPFWGQKISGLRYYNWVQDLLKKDNSMVFVSYVKEKIAGYNVSEITENGIHGILGAVMPDVKAVGLGLAVHYFPIGYAKEHHINRVYTSVSSNNLNSLRSALAVGYQIANIDYVLIKHRTEIK